MADEKTTGVDAPVRLEGGTKDRVKWVGGLLSVSQGEVVKIVLTDYIERYSSELDELHQRLAAGHSPAEIDSVRRRIVPAASD